MALEMGDAMFKMWSGASFFGFDPFSRALCLYATGNETRQSKYLFAAKKVRSKVSEWVRSGAINLVHQLLILDAEDAAAKGFHNDARQAYEKAIAASVRGGFLQDAGIANERYATYLLTVGLERDARYYTREAIRYFSEWGAARKVQQLRQRYSKLLSGSTLDMSPAFSETIRLSGFSYEKTGSSEMMFSIVN